MAFSDRINTSSPQVDADTAETERMLEDSVAGFVAGLGLTPARRLRGTLPGHDPDAWAHFAAQGWLGVLIPEAQGGLGLAPRAMAVVARGLARGLRPEPLVPVAALASTVLAACAGQAAAEELTAIASGDRLVTFVWLDRFGGPALLSTSSGATGTSISGTAFNVPAGMVADRFILAARQDGEVTLLLARADAAGLVREAETRPDGTYSARLVLDNVAVMPLAHGTAAETAMRRGLAVAAVMTAAELQGCMEQALDMTLGYMKTRVQFDRPIGSFQALQHRAVDLYIQKELSGAVLDEALAALAGDDLDHAEMEAARAKARATHAALLIGRESIKPHGAIAYTDDYDAGLFLRRILSLAPQYGNAAESRAAYGRKLRINGGALDAEDSVSMTVPAEFMAEERLEIDWNRFSDDVFRAGVRAYFEANYPHELRHMGRRGSTREMQPWLDRMAAKGWIAPAWPREHGGMGLDPYKQIIFIEERERVGIARNPDQGVVMFGPMLMRFGTEAQKADYLPRILSAEHAWCQGYSEPEAGSDLASLRTEAVRDGDDYVINGSKIWTSSGHHATHMFLLARTDKTVKKQEGISFFILDLKTPGVTIRPITNIAGHDEFCQVFFDNVRIPAANLVGEVNRGWGVAKSLLGFERLNNGSPRRVQGPLKALQALGKARHIADDPVFADRYAGIYLDIADLKSAYSRFADVVRSGRMPGPEISQLKVWAGECAQRLSELLIETAGPAGGIWGKQDLDGDAFNLIAPFYLMFPSQIASGSNDIQRNILSKRVLGLPGR